MEQRAGHGSDGAASRIAEEVIATCGGDPWYGSPLREIVAGIDAQQAAARPIPGAHTIWEIVLHITAWAVEVERRLSGAAPAPPADGDWPVPENPTEDAWQAALARMEAAHRGVAAAVGALSAEALGRIVGGERDQPLGTGVSYERMMYGLLQHDAYHAGQIALLRKFTA